MKPLTRLLTLVRAGPRDLALRVIHRLGALVPSHKTNASGNNQSQR